MKTLRLLAGILLGIATVANAQTDYWMVRPWDYWAATAAYVRMCSNASAEPCYSNVVSADRHILGYQDDGAYAILSVLPTGVGITRDYVAGQLRCFSDTARSCVPASYPPEYAPAVDYVPVLDAAALGTSQPTAGAKVYFKAQTFQVNYIAPADCSVTYGGAIVQSGAHFMLSNLDLGPALGVIPNVYVQEFYSGVPVGAVDPRYGVRMERYFFALGLGRVRQEGWTDPSCTPDPATCLGNYTQSDAYPLVWRPLTGAVAPVAQEICP